MDPLESRTKSKAISGLVGCLLGVGVSFVVNSTLAEISKSRMFAFVKNIQYFGLLFVTLGCAISFRVIKQTSNSAMKKFFLPFGLLIVVSGIICFVLEEDWMFRLRPHSKIPLYGILGISVSFALNFAIVDIVNYAYAYFISPERAVIENMQQIISIVVITSVMGGVFGIVYGVMDYEDEEMYHKHLDLMKEEYYCFPIGAVLGAIAGVANQHFRSEYVRHHDEYDSEEI